jgi:two-component system OmpR family response regulator
MYRVLLVEDDARLAELVTEYLSGYEFAVELVSRGDQALARFQAFAPDVVVLDLMLPGLDGMVVCRQIRELSDVPILILTAREDSYDEVSGLEQGADDFVNKPVQPRVLLARLRALLRRTQPKTAPRSGQDGGELVFGALRIVGADRTVYWRDELCVLSNTEYKLLLVLAEAAGRVLSRDELLKKMRGIEFDGLDRSIDNCISKLRRKFDDAKSEKIKTVWGEGYLFSPSAWG